MRKNLSKFSVFIWNIVLYWNKVVNFLYLDSFGGLLESGIVLLRGYYTRGTFCTRVATQPVYQKPYICLTMLNGPRPWSKPSTIKPADKRTD